MRRVSKIELRYKIEVKLFVTELCPQCAIAIDRIEEIAKEKRSISVNIINISTANNGKEKIKKLTTTPYYLIDGKFVVPGTSSKAYIEGVINSAITNAEQKN